LGRVGWGEFKSSCFKVSVVLCSLTQPNHVGAIPAQHPAGKCKSDPVGFVPLRGLMKLMGFMKYSKSEYCSVTKSPPLLGRVG